MLVQPFHTCFLVHTWVVWEQCYSSPWPFCPHSWWDEIIIAGLLMDLQDRGVECIYDCVWVGLCVSPVTPCVQACSQGQTWWVMNKQWQEEGWLGEIQALRPHWGSGGGGGDGFRGLKRPQSGIGDKIVFISKGKTTSSVRYTCMGMYAIPYSLFVWTDFFETCFFMLPPPWLRTGEAEGSLVNVGGGQW